MNKINSVKNFLLLNILCIYLFSSSNANAKILNLEQVVTKVTTSVVLIQINSRDKESNPVIKSGSGVIIDSHGYILTAAHLLISNESVLVFFNDAKVAEAKVIGFDKRSNVGLIKIEATNLVPVKIGASSKLMVGDDVFALKNIAGTYPYNVISGNVSLTQSNKESLFGVLQTSIFLDPIMGGGPLFNREGELVGINAAIYSKSTDKKASFAIPIDKAIIYANELRTSGKVSWGTLGLNIQELTPELRHSLDYSHSDGVLIASAVEGKPAAKAGIEAGDIIMSIDNQRVNAPLDIPRLVLPLKPGTSVLMEIWKRQSNRVQKVKLIVSEAADF